MHCCIFPWLLQQQREQVVVVVVVVVPRVLRILPHHQQSGDVSVCEEVPDVTCLPPCCYNLSYLRGKSTRRSEDAARNLLSHKLVGTVLVPFKEHVAWLHAPGMRRSGHEPLMMDTTSSAGILGVLDKKQLRAETLLAIPVNVVAREPIEEGVDDDSSASIIINDGATTVAKSDAIIGIIARDGTAGAKQLGVRTTRCVRLTIYLTPETASRLGAWEEKSSNGSCVLSELKAIAQSLEKALEEKFVSLNDAKCGGRAAVPPLYLVATRDSFAIRLQAKDMEVSHEGRIVVRREWHFPPCAIPPAAAKFSDGTFTGLVTFHGIFPEEELVELERKIAHTAQDAANGVYSKETAQRECGRDGVCHRTKFFFGSRYLWTREELKSSDASLAKGIRTDVSPPPQWVDKLVIAPLVSCGVIPTLNNDDDAAVAAAAEATTTTTTTTTTGWVSQVAMNCYHTQEMGLGQHFDDVGRFEAPIVSLRLLASSRLCFGTRFGWVNSLMQVPLERGTVLSMQGNTFAMTGVKHCIRPADLVGGESVSLLLRRIHPELLREADALRQQDNES
ncbi:hypothetical protein RI054_03g16730 [Pseudoscourfieldia marina]